MYTEVIFFAHHNSSDVAKAANIAKSLKKEISKHVAIIAGDQAQQVFYLNYGIKNTLGSQVRSLEPNKTLIEQRFRQLLDHQDSYMVESEPTQSLKVFVDLSALPGQNRPRRLHTYKNALYLHTSVDTFQRDLIKAFKYLALNVFEFASCADKYRETIGTLSYSGVRMVVRMLRARRIFKSSLTFLESLDYINSNTNFIIKPEYL